MSSYQAVQVLSGLRTFEPAILFIWNTFKATSPLRTPFPWLVLLILRSVSFPQGASILALSLLLSSNQARLPGYSLFQHCLLFLHGTFKSQFIIALFNVCSCSNVRSTRTMIVLSFMSQTNFLVNEGENNNKLQTKNRNPRAKRCQTLTHYWPRPATSPRTVLSTGTRSFREPPLATPTLGAGALGTPALNPWQHLQASSFRALTLLQSSLHSTLFYLNQSLGTRHCLFSLIRLQSCVQSREETWRL